MEFWELSGLELAKLSDQDLGQWLFNAWLYHHAKTEGINPNLTLGEWANGVLEKSGKMDSDSVVNAALESMFRKISAGNVAAAGKMFRTFLFNRANSTIRNKHAARDMERQKGTKKPRRPAVDKWMDVQLRNDPAAKSPALWSKAPEWITDQIGKDRFAKRVTAARKRVASK